MSLLYEILEHNRSFVEKGAYEPCRTSRFPDKKLVVLSCMDTRLVELLPKAMNLSNGDAKIIKNAGAIVRDPFDRVMSSLLVAIYELGAEEVCVVGHHRCGMSSIQPEKTVEKMVKRGVSPDVIDTLKKAGIPLEEWLQGFDSVEESVKQSWTLFGIIRCYPSVRYTGWWSILRRANWAWLQRDPTKECPFPQQQRDRFPSKTGSRSLLAVGRKTTEAIGFSRIRANHPPV